MYNYFYLSEFIYYSLCNFLQFEPVLSESSKEYVHHILVYTCNRLTEEDLIGQGGECDQQSGRIRQCISAGGVVIAGWAVGGTVNTLIICIFIIMQWLKKGIIIVVFFDLS